MPETACLLISVLHFFYSNVEPDMHLGACIYGLKTFPYYQFSQMTNLEQIEHKRRYRRLLRSTFTFLAGWNEDMMTGARAQIIEHKVEDMLGLAEQ